MFYSQRYNGRSGALWDIWAEQSMASISQVLRAKFPEQTKELLGQAGPILSELFYVNNEIQREAFLLDGYPTWRHEQQPGDAVFIPPRCPHQVSRIHMR